MPKKIVTQNSFTAGEISPRLFSRSDIAEYQKGLETATNCLPLPHGGVKRRNGFQYIAEVKDSSSAVRLVRYQLSRTFTYILEFGNQYIRFFTDSGQIVEAAKTITGITQANPGFLTVTSHGFSTGQQVYITGVQGMTEINSSTVPYKIANVTANTFSLTDMSGTLVDTTGFTAYTSGGTVQRIYEVTSPYTTAQLDDIQYAQSGTYMYLVHPDVSPRVLFRDGSNTDWKINEIEFLPPPTYESGYENTSVQVTPGATTGVGVNFTASAGFFLGADVGRQIVNLSDGQTGRASIREITSNTVAVCDIVEDFTNTNPIASADWKLDLSPICDLELNGSQAGSVINVRSEYVAGTLGDRTAITNVTLANPGVVTTAVAHGLPNGAKVQIQDVKGMTQINNKQYTVDNATSTTFQLRDEDTSGFSGYTSGGIVRQILTDDAIDAFRAADVGKYILVNGGVMQILTVNSGDDIDCEILKSLNDSETTGNWSLEVATWDSTRGYPKAVGVYQERLIFGGTTTQPQALWLSETGILDGFGAGPDDEDSVQVELSSNQINEISWISSARDLVIGTSGAEITISSGTSRGITPSAVLQQVRTYHGSGTQQVENIKEEIIFVQDSGRKVRTFRYNFNIDGYEGEDITFLAEHITEGGLKELAYAQEPDTIVYAVTNNGTLLAGTYDRPKRIIAWSEFETDGTFESVQTISEGEVNQVWVQVKRTINGSTKRFLEILSSGDGQDDVHAFSDSFLTLSTGATITGITTANPAVITATAHGFSDGDKVIIKDLVDPLAADLDADKTNMSDLNQSSFTVANSTANTFELSGKDTSNFNSYGSGGTAYKKSTTLSGLDHLEGKSVSIRADGAVLPDETVSSGSITLDRSAGEVVVGLPYTTVIKTLSHEFDIGLGSMQGQRARWARPLIRVLNSVRPTVNGEFLPARNSTDKMGRKVPLYSGFLEYGPLKWDNTTAISIETSTPLPLHILGITGVVDSDVK